MVEKSIFKEIGTKSVVEQIVDSIVNAIIEGWEWGGGKEWHGISIPKQWLILSSD